MSRVYLSLIILTVFSFMQSDSFPIRISKVNLEHVYIFIFIFQSDIRLYPVKFLLTSYVDIPIKDRMTFKVKDSREISNVTDLSNAAKIK